MCVWLLPALAETHCTYTQRDGQAELITHPSTHEARRWVTLVTYTVSASRTLCIKFTSASIHIRTANYRYSSNLAELKDKFLTNRGKMHWVQATQGHSIATTTCTGCKPLRATALPPLHALGASHSGPQHCHHYMHRVQATQGHSIATTICLDARWSMHESKQGELNKTL